MSTKQQLFKQQHLDAVKRGVKLLDVAMPGWENDIDVTTLDLVSTSYCMLGQLYGDFHIGKSNLSDALTEARIRYRTVIVGGKTLNDIHYGFEADHWDDEDGCCRPKGYSILTEAWIAVIEKRRAKDVKAERKRRGTDKKVLHG